jgi:two-component system OmpR family response regulator
MKRHRLLVVDDDPATLASLRDVLVRAGYDVDTATTGRDALAKLLDRSVPSAIILDARMPEMDGEEFASVARAYSRFAPIPILLLTAWDTRTAFDAQVNVVMRKPFEVDELLANVEALVASSPTAPR